MYSVTVIFYRRVADLGRVSSRCSAQWFSYTFPGLPRLGRSSGGPWHSLPPASFLVLEYFQPAMIWLSYKMGKGGELGRGHWTKLPKGREKGWSLLHARWEALDSRLLKGKEVSATRVRARLAEKNVWCWSSFLLLAAERAETIAPSKRRPGLRPLLCRSYPVHPSPARAGAIWSGEMIFLQSEPLGV